MESIRITENELKILLEKEKKNGAGNRIVNNIAKAVPTILLIEGICAASLNYRFSFNFFLAFLLFVLADALLLFLIPMTYFLILCIKQAKQSGCNLFSAINLMRLSFKYQKHHKLYYTEICSDKYIAEIDKWLQAEKNLCFSCWLKTMKASALLLQGRIPEVEKIIEELRSLNTKKTALFIELPLLEIPYAEVTENGEAFLAAIKKHKDYIEKRKKK